jgi:hypothetical protein
MESLTGHLWTETPRLPQHHGHHREACPQEWHAGGLVLRQRHAHHGGGFHTRCGSMVSRLGEDNAGAHLLTRYITRDRAIKAENARRSARTHRRQNERVEGFRIVNDTNRTEIENCRSAGAYLIAKWEHPIQCLVLAPTSSQRTPQANDQRQPTDARVGLRGNRDFFLTTSLLRRGRTSRRSSRDSISAVQLDEKDSKLGGVETHAEARKCAELFRQAHR